MTLPLAAAVSFYAAPGRRPTGPPLPAQAWTFLTGSDVSGSPVATYAGQPSGLTYIETSGDFVVPSSGTVRVSVTHANANRFNEQAYNPAISDDFDAFALWALTPKIPHDSISAAGAGASISGSFPGIASSLRIPDRARGAVFAAIDSDGHLILAARLDNGAWFSRGTIEVVGATAPSTPPTAPPSAPAQPTGMAVGSSRIDWQWTKPAGEVTDYDLEVRQGATGQPVGQGYVGTGLAFSDLDINAGVPYQARVRANNTAGASPWSFWSAEVTAAASVPGRPNRPVGTDGTDDNSVTWTWSASTTGGAAVTGWEIEYRIGSSNPASGTSSGTSFTASSLQTGAEYQARVRAINSVGSSQWSAWSAGITATAVLGAPQGLTGAAGATTLNGVAAVRRTWGWTALATATGYQVEVREIDETALFETVTVTDTTHSYTSTRHFPVEARVRGVNVRGPGAWSGWVEARR